MRAIEIGDPRGNLIKRMFEMDACNRLWVYGIQHLRGLAPHGSHHRRMATAELSTGRSMAERIAEKLAASVLKQAVDRDDPAPTPLPCSMRTKAPSTRPAHSSTAWNPTG